MAIPPVPAKLKLHPFIASRRIIAVISKIAIFFIIMLPLECFAQFNISGKVLNHVDKKPVAYATIFLDNALVGNKTADDGTFELHNAQPGKYKLVVSVIGFETYSQTIQVGNSNIILNDIELIPKAIALKEVSIKPKKEDPDREKYYEWFKTEFLGSSDLASDCTIKNPEVIDLDYNIKTNTLTASSYDFIEIDNNALGYRIKYLLSNFTLDKIDENTKRVHYEGSVLFENFKGTSAQEIEWQKMRQSVYNNSSMHFLRALISNQLDQEGFRVLQYANYRKPKQHATLMAFPLEQKDILELTDQQGIYSLSCSGDALHITYNKDHHFLRNGETAHLDDSYNKATTVVSFNSTNALFDDNGGVLNPNSLSFAGYWSRKRIAELLPVDYKPSQNNASDYAIYSKLSNYTDQHITEKAYLHFDKPYYATGDTIYFKAYVTMGERLDLSQLSGILHVDLIGADNKVSQGIKLQLINGLGWGDFALPDTLPKGNYRIRAYTQWQRNEGNYFEQTIPIGSVLNPKVTEISTARIKTINDKADIQFFAEGGNLIDGIRSKIAFKAIGSNGLGIDAKGIVVDNLGKEVTNFASTHLGMGYFYLEPEAGKTYKANITFADGTQNTIDLPLADVKGIALSINNDSLSKATVSIEANPTYYKENKGKEYTLLIYSGGFATTVTVKLDSMLMHLDMLKRHLHTGITRVTLFSQTNEPLCERLIFVQNFDQLNLVLNSDNSIYATREKVSIKLHAKTRVDSAVMGHFSVSVIDENKVPVDENNETTILTNLLLTSDLKGTVEQPNYYFTNVSDEKFKELDLVMLTHGYRKFEWKQVMNDNNPPLTWQPEKDLQITGIAKSLFGKPLYKASVALISFQPKFLTNTVSDDKGKFLFNNLVFTDSAKFTLQAVNAKGKNKTQLSYNEDKPLPIIAAMQQTENTNALIPFSYLENNEQQQEELNKLGLGKGRILKEVRIRDVKRDDKYETQSLAGAGNADQVMHSEEIEKIQGPLATSLDGRLRGVTFAPISPFEKVPVLRGGGRMLVVVDGAEVPPESINNYTPNDIETIEVLKYASAAVYGMQGGNGVLVITTKRGAGTAAKDIVSVGILPITVQGYYKAREFYSPKYESNITSPRPDLRSTIYWQPELTTDKDGNASFDYYNSDGAGSYRVVIEGIDEKGNIGRQVYRYKVQHSLAYGQTEKYVFNKLKNYSATHLTEKAYLHFDKPYYATGDTIYFKAYVTMGERLDLSQLSGILHVDLIGTDNKISKGIKLQLVNGLGWGDFALSDTLPKGNYRIRAYTQWQRNEGNYFEQTIPVGSVHNQRVPESSTVRSKAVNAKADIQFFTEGGNLINGIRSKIAFKAIGVNGLGIEARGIVTDNSGKNVGEFSSAHLGMGYFYLSPEDGKTYKANITFADGTQNIVDLPLADTKGIALSINNDSLPKATVKIEANSAYFKENKGKDYTLLIYSGGFATTVTVKLDSVLLHLDILKRHLHTGITRITLFSQKNEPLCERLMFVQNFDQLNLALNSDKSIHAAREKVNIRLLAKTRADSAAMGHFSVAVINENKVPVDENAETTILTNLLLTSDLKGTVEQPNYYFANINDEKLKNLELVMLTQGYRKFEWKQVMSDGNPPLAWKPEKDLQITGIAKSLFGKPLDKAAVALISFQPKFLTNTVSDDKGKFLFNNLIFTDSVKFILQAVNAKGKNKTQLSYNEDKPAPPVLNSLLSMPFANGDIPGIYLENNEKQQEELNKLGLGTGRVLKEVKIKAKKEPVIKNPRYGMPDKVISGDKILYGGSLSVRLASLIHFSGPMLIVWNGIEMPRDFNIDEIGTGSIESIEVYTNQYGPGYSGVLSINTAFGLQVKDMIATGILPINVQGYYKAREFYSPKYKSNITTPQPDLRSTIYWQPELTTDKDGHASFDYYNADGKGNYRVVVEGIDEKGNIGRQVYRYKVE